MANLSTNLIRCMIEDDFSSWCNILQTTPDVVNLLNCLNSIGYPIEKLRQIRQGIEHGIPCQRLNFFFTTTYNSNQTEQLLFATIQGFTEEQISLFSSRFMHYKHMEFIRICIKEGYEIEKIKLLSDPTYTIEKMETIKKMFDYDLSTLSRLINSKATADQLEQIHLGLKHGISLNKILLYAKPIYCSGQMKQIRKGLEQGMRLEQLSLFFSPKYSEHQMKHIRLAIQKEYSEEQISLLRAHSFFDKQLEQIVLGIENGLSYEQIKLYAIPAYHHFQMNEIRIALKNGLNNSQIALFSFPEIPFDMMQKARTAIESGLNKKELEEQVLAPITKKLEKINTLKNILASID